MTHPGSIGTPGSRRDREPHQQNHHQQQKDPERKLMSEEQLERSILERKASDELRAIATAMSLEPVARTRKADLVNQILLSLIHIYRVPIHEAQLGLLVHDRELELLRCLVDLPYVVGEAARDRACLLYTSRCV